MSTTNDTPLTPAQRRKITPALRAALVAWPAGEARIYQETYTANVGFRWYGTDIDQWEHALKCGFVTARHKNLAAATPLTPGTMSWYTARNTGGLVLTRTDHSIKPSPRQPAERKLPAYSDPHWPWSVSRHWKRMRESPLRAPYVMRLMMTASHDPDRIGFEPYVWHTHQQWMSWVVVSKQHLKQMRNTLAIRLGRARVEVMSEDYGLLNMAALDGHRLRLYMLDMGVTPVWDAMGNVRFVPIDDLDAAAEEYWTLVGGRPGTSPRERYEAEMRRVP